MFEITKSVDIDFAHHVSGHLGKCINIHGHTWKFEVSIGAEELDENGFVVDFGVLKRKVLEPVKILLDHSLALSEKTFKKIEEHLLPIGKTLITTRPDVESNMIDIKNSHILVNLNQARLWECAGINVTTFLFTPTSERLAKWLYEVAENAFRHTEIEIIEAKVYEQLHPVAACAIYREN